MKTPTWAQIERFCRIDGWVEARRSGHVFFEKVLVGGTVLQTHRSHASRSARGSSSPPPRSSQSRWAAPPAS